MSIAKAKYPQELIYEASISWDKKTGGTINTGKGFKVKFDIPKEFGGKETAACPDELFLSSIAACVLTTFLFYKEVLRLKLRDVKLHVRGRLMLVKNKYRFREINIAVEILVKKDERNRAQRCFDLARETCNLTSLIHEIVPVNYNLKIKELQGQDKPKYA